MADEEAGPIRSDRISEPGGDRGREREKGTGQKKSKQGGQKTATTATCMNMCNCCRSSSNGRPAGQPTSLSLGSRGDRATKRKNQEVASPFIYWLISTHSSIRGKGGGVEGDVFISLVFIEKGIF